MTIKIISIFKQNLLKVVKHVVKLGVPSGRPKGVAHSENVHYSQMIMRESKSVNCDNLKVQLEAE